MNEKANKKKHTKTHAKWYWCLRNVWYLTDFSSLSFKYTSKFISYTKLKKSKNLYSIEILLFKSMNPDNGTGM